MSRRLPAEWEPQSAVQLTWPDAETDWGPTLDRVEPVFVNIARAILARQPLLVIARDAAHATRIRERIHAEDSTLSPQTLHPLHLGLAPADDTWARDHGAITVLDNDAPVLLDFVFNGWGGKFAAARDNAITAELVRAGVFGNTHHAPQDLVLEGGSIESDGQGTLLTTRHCLGTPTRNPDRSMPDIEAALQQLFGVDRVLWLEHGALEGDDTDGHIDTLARLIAPDAIAHVVCEDPDDPHHSPLLAMREELRALRTRDGRPYCLVELPLPAPIRDAEEQRLPATHANFLFVNGALLLPTYADPTDAIAIERLSGALPDREIVPIDCREIIRQGGSLHCLTMQYPDVVPIVGQSVS